MSDVFVNIKDPDVWIRPNEWLPIDNLASVGDHKFVGLLAIIPNQQNQLRVRVGGITYSVDWGDGTSQTSIGSGAYSDVHNYDFNSISSPLTKEGWKQVIVTIYPTTPGVTFSSYVFVDQSSVGINNWLDIKMVSTTCTSLTIGSVKRIPYLKKFTYAGSHANIAINSMLPYSALEEFNMDFSNTTTLASTFLGASGRIFNTDTNINTIANSLTSMFQSSNIRKVGNIAVTGSTALLQTFYQAQVLESIGNISAPSASNMQTFASACTNLTTVGSIDISLATNALNAFNGCYRLQTIGTITTSANLTTINAMFNGCNSLQGVTITNCSSLTGTGVTNAFLNCFALNQLSLPGIKISLSVANTAMQRDALVSLFNDLGTPATTQIITVTGTPGSANLTAGDIAIATGKNWTVTL